MTLSSGGGRPGWSSYFDPETETDPVIRQHVTLPPWGTPKNDPAVTGASGQRYPVWAVYLNYVSAGEDVAGTVENYGGDLTAEQVEAARRFAQAYPEVVMPYVSAALDG